MTQPVQIYGGTGGTTGVDIPQSAFYSVIDNSAPGNLNHNGVAIPGQAGYDKSYPGAIAQGKNVFLNGNIPDAVANATPIITNPASATIRFKNPA